MDSRSHMIAAGEPAIRPATIVTARTGWAAPNLVSFPGSSDFAGLKQVPETGHKGKVGVMHNYKDNPNINKRLEDIYHYLKARARDAFPRERCQRRSPLAI